QRPSDRLPLRGDGSVARRRAPLPRARLRGRPHDRAAPAGRRAPDRGGRQRELRRDGSRALPGGRGRAGALRGIRLGGALRRGRARPRARARRRSGARAPARAPPARAGRPGARQRPERALAPPPGRLRPRPAARADRPERGRPADRPPSRLHPRSARRGRPGRGARAGGRDRRLPEAPLERADRGDLGPGADGRVLRARQALPRALRRAPRGRGRGAPVLRAGVVGAGSMGGNHARVYAALTGGCELAGVYDLDPERARAVARRWGGRAYATLEELLDAVDVVSIASPTSCHFEHVRDALARGVHVLVEKPAAATAGEALRLLELARTAPGRPVVQVGHIEEFNPAVAEARKLLADEELIGISAQRLSPFDGRIQDVDVVQDLMLHDVHVALSLVGAQPTAVRAAGRSVHGAGTVYDAATP